MDTQSPIAVLTGDIIGFSAYTESTRKEILASLHQAAALISELYPQHIPCEIGLYRGDGWQLVISEPSLALRIALLIRCFLKTRINKKNMDTRVAIAIGEADYLPEESLQTGDGEAFRASGYLLESLPRQTHLGCRWPAADSAALEEVLDAMLQLLDTLVNQWTVKQALAVYGALQGWRQMDIARSWQPEAISQQAVAQHLDSANWSVVAHALSVFERTFGHVDGGDTIQPPAS
jgi:hypothetical protein